MDGAEGILWTMNTMRYVYWQAGDMWLGYIEEFPDYMTQGQTLEELEENLKDIYQETRRLTQRDIAS